MNRLNEALVILMEEASEVAQAASKCIRFNEDKDYIRLEEELGDFMCLYQWFADRGLIDVANVAAQVGNKEEKLKKYSKLFNEDL